MLAVMEYINNFVGHIKGFLEVAFSSSPDFKYAIKNIELKKIGSEYQTIIYYQVVGTRHIQHAPAKELNNSTLFANFRPQEAQVIVAIATIESALSIQKEELADRYFSYVESCSLKLKAKKV